MLDKQVQIISCDTSNFYTNHEASLHWKNHKLKTEKNQLINGAEILRKDNKTKRKIIGTKEIEELLNKKYEIDKKEINPILDGEYNLSVFEENEIKEIINLCEYYVKAKEWISLKNNLIKKTKDDLLKLLENKVEANIQSNGKHHIRVLNENQITDKHIISVFDSFFTRTIGAKPDNFTEDFMVIQIFYYDIIKDLIYHGFTYKGEKYIYFTSSAGQIRTKKVVFVKESVWKEHEKTIMCGLTLDDINAKGGNNPNKHLAYLALANSATDVWEEFDIDKTIVINDFETNVFGTYDLVDDMDYSIKRISDYVPIEHTDGCGMVLPNAFGVEQKNKMVRLPWVKGLLGVFDFAKFIEVNNCSPIIKDIYGVEHDVIKEDIQVIFTKSQTKMWKYYDSWGQYKTLYKQYGCTAGYTNPEEERIKDATINYQMLQTLTDITDEEISKIAGQSINTLNNISSSIDNIKNVFGVTPYNINKTAFQKSIELYPDLINDEYAKITLRDIKDSLIKKSKSGKLKIHGKYTFILPDLYAACQHWFMGEENPKGLLEDSEVFCWLFRKNEKLDCLRSPHLFMEHAIRNNIACNKNERQQELREWYCTDAIYTSCHDLISKVLQFDVDGDKSLVVADKTLIEVAERNIEKYDIVPLYYNMRKAEAILLNNKSIYNGLNAAFSGGNIGIYSNSISKIWNDDVFIFGTEKEKQEAIDVIKLLCMENNFVIDYAKTLYKPERPDYVDELISKYTKLDLPHFFKYAKDKEDYQVEEINNSFVNKLNNIIPNPRINCRSIGLGKIDYRLLMNNQDIEFEVALTENGKLIREESNPLIVKYHELNKKYGYSIMNNSLRVDNSFSGEVLKNSQLRQELKYKELSKTIKDELSQFGYSDIEATDILVKYLYGIKESRHKSILWICYGDIIYENLKNKLKLKTKTIQCVDCGEWFEVDVFDSATCRCKECLIEHKREITRLRVQKHRKNKM